MKEYEIYSNLKVPKCSKTILRLDGRGFHSLANHLNLEKPYDKNFSDLMVNVALNIFKEFYPLFIYTFSDEINILLNEVPFNGRIEKLNSVMASFASSSFSLNLNNDYKPVSFDCRIISIIDISKYFKWRQDEAWRNCVNSYGIWILKEKFSKEVANEKIKGLKLADIHELLFSFGINLNNIENWKKRGIAIYKYNDKIYKDYNIPIFSNEFFKTINII